MFACCEQFHCCEGGVTGRLTMPAGENADAKLVANPNERSHASAGDARPWFSLPRPQNCAKRWLTESWRQRASLKVILAMQTDDCSADAGGQAHNSTWFSSGLLNAEGLLPNQFSPWHHPNWMLQQLCWFTEPRCMCAQPRARMLCCCVTPLRSASDRCSSQVEVLQSKDQQS
jgi:hypothetical protein